MRDFNGNLFQRNHLNENKIIVLSIIISLFVFGCNNKAKELEEKNNLLVEHLQKSEKKYGALEDFVEEYTETINSVQEELTSLDGDNEYMVSYDDLGNVNLVKKTKESILNHIAELKEKLKINQQLLNQLEISRDKITKLEKTIINLQKDLDHREEIINGLKGDNVNLQFSIKDLEKQLSLAKNELNHLQDKNQNLLNENENLLSEVNRKYCIVVSKKWVDAFEVTNQDNINFNNANVDLLTTHNYSSYSLNKIKRKKYTLEIKNYESFWRNTKFLVVHVRK